MSVVSEKLKDVNDNFSHEQFIVVQFDVGLDETAIWAEETGQLKGPELKGRAHDQPNHCSKKRQENLCLFNKLSNEP